MSRLWRYQRDGPGRSRPERRHSSGASRL